MHTGTSGIIHLSCVVSLWIADTLLHTLYLTVEVKRRRRQSSGKPQYVFYSKSCLLCLKLIMTEFLVLLLFCRINVGGKLLTNHLKEIISYR